jgi:hypothetical protein
LLVVLTTHDENATQPFDYSMERSIIRWNVFESAKVSGAS